MKTKLGNSSETYIRTLAGAKKFLAEHARTDRAHPCCHGNDCSTYDNGPCLDETLSNFPELESDQ